MSRASFYPENYNKQEKASGKQTYKESKHKAPNIRLVTADSRLYDRPEWLHMFVLQQHTRPLSP